MKLKQGFSSEIKNIIFDFGAVIINIDYHLTEKAFQNLGIKNFNELFSKAKQSNLFDNLEKGIITESDFCNDVRKISELNISNQEITNAWNAMLLDLPKERIELIALLKNNYKTFLLSNTNKIHADAFFITVNESVGIKSFYDAFDKIYLSHEIKMRKPNKEIFELVLSENKIKKEETLFIDDSIQHIESAANIGLHVHHLKDSETIFDLFEQDVE